MNYHGYGCFETLLLQNGHIFFVQDHINRLIHTCEYLNIKYPNNIYDQVLDYASRLDTAQQYRINLIQYINQDIIIQSEIYNPPAKAYKLCQTDYSIYSHNPLSQYKTCNYLLYILSKQQAQSQDYNQAILLNESNNIVEASYANLFFCINNQWVTPPLKAGCLNGIMRKYLINILDCTIQNINTSILSECQYILASNSLILINPVQQVYVNKILHEYTTLSNKQLNDIKYKLLNKDIK